MGSTSLLRNVFADQPLVFDSRAHETAQSSQLQSAFHMCYTLPHGPLSGPRSRHSQGAYIPIRNPRESAERRQGAKVPTDIKSIDQLVAQGKELAPHPQLKWSQAQGARQAAFLCSSSGTSGLPVSFLFLRWRYFHINIFEPDICRLEKCHDLA